jgi:enamine deaminase RidA (YjgF/YER057c/UK114 family)
MMKKELIYKIDDMSVMGMPGSTGPAAQCYRVGNLVFMMGQTAFTLDGDLVGVGDAAAQARQACENIKSLMQMAGGTLSDVVKITVYVTDRLHRDAAYPVIRSYFDLWPCGTGLVVRGLARPELLVEIDAWGFVDDPDEA